MWGGIDWGLPEHEQQEALHYSNTHKIQNTVIGNIYWGGGSHYNDLRIGELYCINK